MKISDFTEEQLEFVGNKWTHPKTNKHRYYLNPTNILEVYGYIFGMSRREEAIFFDKTYKYWIEDGVVKSTLPFDHSKKKSILLSIEYNLYKMLGEKSEVQTNEQ